jgi:hypothetical protein
VGATTGKPEAFRTEGGRATGDEALHTERGRATGDEALHTERGRATEVRDTDTKIGGIDCFILRHLIFGYPTSALIPHRGLLDPASFLRFQLTLSTPC